MVLTKGSSLFPEIVILSTSNKSFQSVGIMMVVEDTDVDLSFFFVATFISLEIWFCRR